MSILSKKPLSGNSLKLIAGITMIFDHVGLVLFPDILIFRIIGRISFPIYAFLICEGMQHSKNQINYMLRLALMAVISEPIFDMVIYGGIGFEMQNIFFTLLCGAATIFVCEKSNTWIWGMMGMVAGHLLLVDYGSYGVMLIILFWFYREDALQIYTCIGIFAICFLCSNIVMLFAYPITPALILEFSLQVWAMLSAPLLLAYSGKRGFEQFPKKIVSLGFYAIYPTHLLIILFLK